MDRHLLHLPGGDLEYVDSGGTGPVAVLLHGALMDERLWLPTIEKLSGRVRCVAPVLPMGAHRHPRPKDADQSPHGLARLAAELIRALDRQDVTLVGNDTGGALAQLLVADEPDLVSRLVLVSCDAFENFPPGLPGRTMAMACAVPGGMRTAMASLRVPAFRRLPMTFGWMAKRPIPSQVITAWLDAYGADRGVRRDVVRMMRQVDRTQLVHAEERLKAFPGEVLIVWAAQDRVMPVDHARRLRDAFGDARVEMVDDSYTLVPLDQPRVLANHLATFVAGAENG